MTEPTWTETDVRALVAEQFAQLLPGVELQGTDNFFRRGGDSLGMLRVLSVLESQGLPLTARDFVTRPTLDGIVDSVLARLAQVTAVEPS